MSSSSDSGYVAVVIIVLMFIVTCDRIGDNKADIRELERQYKHHKVVYHVDDSDDWLKLLTLLGYIQTV